MRKLFLITAIVFIFTGLGAQDKKVYDENAEVRITGKEFHSIKISGGIDMFLSQDNETKVVASATETKFRDRIKTEIADGILKIWYDSDGWKWNTGHKKLRVYVSCKSIDKLTATGASDVNIEGTLKAGDLEIHLSGASDLKGKISATKIIMDQSGASDARVSGDANDLKLKVSGASDFKGFDFLVHTCEVKASGASDIQITVNKGLSAHASGASDIRYKGNALIRNLHTGGASSVKKSG
jgi:Putative auto-transporter adhesin, head GIN domain